MVRVSETYDLSTKVNNMGIVGIHTPTGALIDKLWGGLVMQHKKFRFVSCDVAMACASLLPADPLQVGVEAGEIAPQDMFNPILYKAVSNDNMNTLLNYIQSLASATSTSYNLVNQGSVAGVNDAGFKTAGDLDVDQFQMYYALLADSDGWKKAMPQAGLSMRGLFPLVYQMVSTYGVNQYSDAGDSVGGSSESRHFLDDLEPVMAYGPDSSAGAGQRVYPYKLRGPAMRMPSINTVCYGDSADTTLDIVTASPPVATGLKSNTGQVPPCYVGLIILPPAKLNQLYYRLKVTWTIEFTGLRTINDTSIWSDLAGVGTLSYGTDYAEQSQTMSAKESMVDADHAMLTKIMEGA